MRGGDSYLDSMMAVIMNKNLIGKRLNYEEKVGLLQEDAIQILYPNIGNMNYSELTDPLLDAMQTTAASLIVNAWDKVHQKKQYWHRR